MKEIILAQKHNATYDKLIADLGILQELDQFLTFKAPNYFYHPLFKRKLWNGDIHIFKIKDRLLYTGLHSKLEEFCTARNYQLIYEELNGNKDFSEDEAKAFVEELNLPYELYEHQLIAFISAVRESRCVIISPTSSGKSLMMYLIFKFYKKKTLIIVPSLGLIQQTVKNFVFFGLDEDDVHFIYEGQSKKTDRSCVISTWHSLMNEKPEYFDQYECIIVDEVHTAAAKELKDIMEKSTKCYLRFGFTGTLTDSKTNELVIQGLFGKIIRITTTKELMDKGVVSPLDIKCVVLNHDKVQCKLHKKDSYDDEFTYISSKPERNSYIANLACSLKGNTIVFFRLIEEQGDLLYKEITSKTNRPVYYIHGKIPADERERIRIQAESEENCIILASYGTSSTGIDISKIHNIIFASPYKAIVKVLQSIGRGLRLHSTKNKCNLFDIADNMVYNKRINHTYKHFLARLVIYNKEKFSYKIFNNIELKENPK